MSDPLIPIALFGITAVVIDLAMLWICARAVRKSPAPMLLLSAIVIAVAAANIGSKLLKERSAIKGVTRSPDARHEMATYLEKNPSRDEADWTVYIRPRGFRLFARSKSIFHGNNFSRVETQWQSNNALLILCDCSAGIVWDVEPSWAGVPVKLVEMPSVGLDQVPIRPKDVPQEAVRVNGEWIVCQTAQSGETWNRCRVYADKTGSLIASGRFQLRQHERAASRDELQYTMYDDNLFNKPEGGWIYLRDGILEALPLAQFGPRIDLEKQYARPTITVIGPFDLMVGKPPKVHIFIQYGATQYICSANSESEVKATGLKVGANVDISEQGKYLNVRGTGQRKWLKLRLVSKGELHNL